MPSPSTPWPPTAYLDDDTDLIGPVHALAWAELATARIGPRQRPLSRLSDGCPTSPPPWTAGPTWRSS